MPGNRQELSTAGLLRPLAVRNYAESRGWQPVDEARGRLWVFRHPSIPLRQVQIPMDTDFEGFPDAMLDVAERLAELEDRGLPEVMADLLHPDADTLRFAVVGPASQGGDVPLADDLRLRDGARRALLAAALFERRPAAYHPRLWTAEAEQFLRDCRAGQTEVGSYVVRIICPLGAGQQDSPLPAPGEGPFARRVTRRIMESLSTLALSIERGSVAMLSEHDSSAAPRISWNICDALLRMRPGEAGKLDMSVSWAAAHDVSRPDNIPSHVSLPDEYFPEVERVATRLRPPQSPERASFWVGTVERLDGVTGEDGRRAGDVVLALLDEEGEAVPARASLTADQYAIADDAHMQGLGYVRVRGVLRRGQRMGRIEPLIDFSLLDPTPGLAAAG